MVLGFIIIRHVNDKVSDLYWKECYTCIRKFYDNPILIIDDSSKKEFLNENIFVKNCTVIYDTEHKGSAELLPYYYFYKLKPFDTAVIIHDSIFIQQKIDFSLLETEQIKYLWTFSHQWDDEIFHLIDDLIHPLPKYSELHNLYHRKNDWIGCFGGMSVIRWDFVDTLQTTHQIFDRMLPRITKRENRYGLERAFPLVTHFCQPKINTFFGDIHSYIQWGLTFSEYLSRNYTNYPIVKVWSSR
jgi:hypothetical protein